MPKAKKTFAEKIVGDLANESTYNAAKAYYKRGDYVNAAANFQTVASAYPGKTEPLKRLEKSYIKLLKGEPNNVEYEKSLLDTYVKLMDIYNEKQERFKLRDVLDRYDAVFNPKKLTLEQEVIKLQGALLLEGRRLSSSRDSAEGRTMRRGSVSWVGYLDDRDKAVRGK